MKNFSIRDMLKGADERQSVTDMMYEPEPAHQNVAPPAPPKRIGELPPHPYIDTTRERLASIHTKYSAELDKLKADIDKLSEEHRQLFVSWLAIGAALGALETEANALPADNSYDETVPGPNG